MGYTAIVDYGVGNLKSVTNAMDYLGLKTCITSDPKELELADAIILPGVGAFPDAADKLRGTGLDQVLVGTAVLLAAMPIGTTVALLADKYGKNAAYAGELVLITTLCSMLTLPVWSYLCLFWA